MTRTDLFDYDLPRELIATTPAEKRDESRLLVLDRARPGEFAHRRFRELKEYLREGDLLVVNDSRVIPARLFGRRASGGQAEFLLLKRRAADAQGDIWEALARPAKRLRAGDVVEFAGGELRATIESEGAQGIRVLRFKCADVLPWLEKIGAIPLPPYIVQRRKETHAGAAARTTQNGDEYADLHRYQSVYARDPGSVAAPTAGLHFSQELLRELDEQGVRRAAVTLHVGPGTFKPVETETLEEHDMHEEQFSISPETAASIEQTRSAGGRVIAVGTTVVRALESAALQKQNSPELAGNYSTRLLIAPGFGFQLVDALITNFHLPRSTLLALVSAFATRDQIMSAYDKAIREQYRFYSYGDAMLIL